MLHQWLLDRGSQQFSVSPTSLPNGFGVGQVLEADLPLLVQIIGALGPLCVHSIRVHITPYWNRLDEVDGYSRDQLAADWQLLAQLARKTELVVLVR